jgi:hypothetical protein
MSGSDLNIIPPQFKELNLACGHPFNSYLFDLAIHIACPQCGKISSIEKGVASKVGEKKVLNLVKSFCLTLGSTGEIDGRKYRVVGMMVRNEDAGYRYSWREYTLFNPVHGYIWLSEYDGHWTKVVTLNNPPSFDLMDFEFSDGENDYRLFNSYRSTIVFASGEFAEEINVDEKVKCREFLCAPNMLICEKRKTSVQWMNASYIDGDEVKKAFQPTIIFPEKVGVGACEPFLSKVPFVTMARFTFLILFLLTLVQIIYVATRENKIVFFQSFNMYDVIDSKDSAIVVDAAGNILFAPTSVRDHKTFVTEPMEFKNGRQGIEFELEAPVSNNWMECDIELINDKTGEQFSFSQGAEYYFGYTGGEHWTEGSTQASQFISSVPEGRYRMAITAYINHTKPIDHFTLYVYRDVSIWSNYFLSMLVLLIYPVVFYVRKISFEKKRWMNSDYSPYESEYDE